MNQAARRFRVIGFDREIKLDWLDRAARLVREGAGRAEVVAALDDDLRATFPTAGDGSRNARDKTLSVVLCTWAIVPEDLASFRDDGLA